MKVFITGGTSGIGLEMAKIYLSRGCVVGVCGRDLSKIPKDIQDNKNLQAFKVDIKDRENVIETLRSFSNDGIDIVIANAGISMSEKSKLPNFKSSKEVFEINLLGVLYTAEAVLEKMLDQKNGQFVTVSSVAGFVGLPGVSAYSASKAAVTTLMESYDLDLSDQGVSFTNICPGFIDTPFTKKNKHPMPFLMSANDAALKIVKAIDKKKKLYVFPWQMTLVMCVLDKLPRFVYRFLMKLPMLNYSRI